MEKFVSVIIPCRNEERFIAQCLDSVLANDYPKDKMELFVVDGMSKDKTREIVEGYTKKYPFIKLLDNPKYIAPCALNIGIKESKGDVIIRIDAHATYDKSYISKCVACLQKYGADNVGGVIKTLPAKETLFAKSIAISLSHFFGAASSFRLGSDKPKEVDTVFGGCYRKEVFKKIGFFNENLQRSQDMEFNLRLKKAGGKIILSPDIIAYYYPSPDLKDFFLHTFRDGIWAVYPLKFVKIAFKPRHYIPLAFVSGLIFLLLLGLFLRPFLYLFLVFLFLYLATAIYFSAGIALKEKNVGFLFSLPLSFAARHFGYGLGSIVGVVKIIFS